jgi:hypothetical protein
MVAKSAINLQVGIVKNDHQVRNFSNDHFQRSRPDLTRSEGYVTPMLGYVHIQASNVRVGTLLSNLLCGTSQVLVNAFHFGRMQWPPEGLPLIAT